MYLSFVKNAGFHRPYWILGYPVFWQTQFGMSKPQAGVGQPIPSYAPIGMVSQKHFGTTHGLNGICQRSKFLLVHWCLVHCRSPESTSTLGSHAKWNKCSMTPWLYNIQRATIGISSMSQCDGSQDNLPTYPVLMSVGLNYKVGLFKWDALD